MPRTPEVAKIAV